MLWLIARLRCPRRSASAARPSTRWARLAGVSASWSATSIAPRRANACALAHWCEPGNGTIRPGLPSAASSLSVPMPARLTTMVAAASRCGISSTRNSTARYLGESVSAATPRPRPVRCTICRCSTRRGAAAATSRLRPSAPVPPPVTTTNGKPGPGPVQRFDRQTGAARPESPGARGCRLRSMRRRGK